jgi:ribosomal RNA-processing protein 12
MDSMEDNYEAVPFSKVVESLCTPGRDENSTKTAAVAAALVEVIQEKLIGANSFEKVSPAALFASTLNALASTVTSDTIDVASSPQLSLLEILRQVIPYVSASNPNLYLHQFSTTSRALRGVIASIPKSHHAQDQSQLSIGWNALLRQCIRTACVALNGILVLENGKSVEKEILKCFHSTILQHFDDARPKVRRQAHASTLELLHLSSSIESTAMMKLIPDHMVEYSYHILEAFLSSLGQKKKKKENEFETREKNVRLMHLLSFLESFLLITDVASRLKIGGILMKILERTISVEQIDDALSNILVANGLMSALLQIFDHSNRDNYGSNLAEEDAFCAQQWAILLQSSVKIVAITKNGNEGSGECRTLYARAVVAISTRLLSENISGAQKPVMDALLPKLLPLSFTTVINCVGDEDIQQEAVQSICAELSRLIRCDGIKRVLKNEVEMDTSAKFIESCVGAVSKVLHFRFRSNWDATLPCLASLAVAIVQGMIPSSGSDETSMAKMQARVKPLVQGLVQLYADVDDKNSKQVIEDSVGIVVKGVGAEIFMGLVNLSEGSNDANIIHGAVSNDLAWILNVIKSSISADSNPYRPRLAFFQSHVLGLARKCDAASSSDNLTAVEASIQRTRVIDLWSLFPSFCAHPLDVETTFPALAQTLVRAMSDKRYPELLVS